MKRIHRVFVANRGEIALRIISACRQLGIETVLGTSDADREGLAAREADRAVCLGPAPAAQSLSASTDLALRRTLKRTIRSSGRQR